MRSCWSLLGIEPTGDIREIRRAYADAARCYSPEDDPQAFQDVRAAYETALAEASSPPGPDQPDDHGNIISLQSELALAVGTDDRLAAAALLESLVDHPAMGNLFVRAETESWLATMLVDLIPRSDPLIARAVMYFDWDIEDPPRFPQVEMVLERHDEILLIKEWSDRRSRYRLAWDILVAPPGRSSRLGTLNPAVRHFVRTILARVDRYPRLAMAFDPDSVAAWREAFARQAELKQDLRRAIPWWTGAALVHWGFGGGEQPAAVALSTAWLAATGVTSIIPRGRFGRLADHIARDPERHRRVTICWIAMGLVMLALAVEHHGGYWGSLAILATGLAAFHGMALTDPRWSEAPTAPLVFTLPMFAFCGLVFGGKSGPPLLDWLFAASLGSATLAFGRPSLGRLMTGLTGPAKFGCYCLSVVALLAMGIILITASTPRPIGGWSLIAGAIWCVFLVFARSGWDLAWGRLAAMVGFAGMIGAIALMISRDISAVSTDQPNVVRPK